MNTRRRQPATCPPAAVAKRNEQLADLQAALRLAAERAEQLASVHPEACTCRVCVNGGARTVEDVGALVRIALELAGSLA